MGLIGSCLFPTTPAFLLSAAMALPLLTLAITYPLATYDHQTTAVVSFISATIDHPPAQCIGTLGLGLAIFAMTAVATLRHAFVERFCKSVQASLGSDAMVHGFAARTTVDSDVERRGTVGSTTQNTGMLESQRRGAKWKAANDRSRLVLYLSCVGGMGVVSFQWHNQHTVHNTSAAIFFYCGLIYTITDTNLDALMAKLTLRVPRDRLPAGFAGLCPTMRGVRLRRLNSVVGFACVFLFQFFMFDRALRAKSKLYINLAATFEISAFACFALHMVSHMWLFRQLTCSVVVHAKGTSLEHHMLEDPTSSWSPAKRQKPAGDDLSMTSSLLE